MDNQFAVISGAASGIGNTVAKLLIGQGVTVFAIDIKPVEIPNAVCIQCDVSCEADVERAIRSILSVTDRIDWVVLAAGILCHKWRYELQELPSEEWTRVMNVNLNGTLFCLKHLIPLLKKSNSASVVTYSSEQVVRPIEKSAPYLVSKAGIEALTKLAALELLSDRIRVNCIRAATVDTDFLNTLVREPHIRQEMRDSAHRAMPYGIIRPEEIAQFTVFLLSEQAAKITGQIMTVDSGVLL